jgi:hypothetical protein
MSEADLGIGFIVGLIVGAYGAYLAHPIIEMGVGLMKIRKAENKKIKEEELKTTNDSTNDANPPAEENTTQHPTPKENHSTTNQPSTTKPTAA